ncbi:hypothetical protein OXH62_26345 [Pseudomonas chlororaphis]|uniref:hypothetical protein n=1 Tax=Pseudomonas chlororaphis TaxID=587753 RepID=UPI0035D4D518
MAVAQEIFDKLVFEYPKFIKSITELSYNRAGGQNFIGSDVCGFDFDMVYNLSPSYSVTHNEKSPDALFCMNNKLWFIEFKEGGHKKIEIRSKIHEGILTLFMFVQRHLPHITKEVFCNLDIRYAVISRETQKFSSFAQALKAASEKYQLKNIEGFLVSKVFYTVDPNRVADLLSAVTAGAVGFIEYYDGTTNPPARISVN